MIDVLSVIKSARFFLFDMIVPANALTLAGLGFPSAWTEEIATKSDPLYHNLLAKGLRCPSDLGKQFVTPKRPKIGI